MYHASGGPEGSLTGLLDNVPMHCLSTQLLHQLMVTVGKGSLAVVMGGKSYDVETLASSCAASFSPLLEVCDLGTMKASLAAQYAMLPEVDEIMANVIMAMHRACLEDPAVSQAFLPFELLGAAFGVSAAELAIEFDPFFDALGLTAPGVAACAQYQPLA